VFANIQAKGVSTRTTTRRTSVAEEEGRGRRAESSGHSLAIDPFEIAHCPVIAASASDESVAFVGGQTAPGKRAPLKLGPAESSLDAFTNVSESNRRGPTEDSHIWSSTKSRTVVASLRGGRSKASAQGQKMRIINRICRIGAHLSPRQVRALDMLGRTGLPHRPAGISTCLSRICFTTSLTMKSMSRSVIDLRPSEP